jgi:hypothetical protein
MQRGVVRDKRKRAIDSFQRLAMLAELLQKDGKQAARGRMRGLPRNELAQRRHRFGNVSALRQT